MCGFAGEFLFGSGQADLLLAQKMASRLHHRGPDESGSFLSADGRCAIGFQRLAVIDPVASHQPMSSEGGEVTLAFNGEIYNFKALKEEFLREAPPLKTRGDTEVLLRLYKRQGEKMLSHLRGMFAMAIYDRRDNSLFLARDRMGQKPLWYSRLPDRIVFASEAKALLVHPMISREMNHQSVGHYLCLGYIPAPDSIWKKIHKLLPGNYLKIKTGDEQTQKYWRPTPQKLSLDDSDLPDLVRRKIHRSVEKQMISDVPLGALLSGGIDSSIVVALMARIAGAAGGVRTFTAGFEEASFDERDQARQIAQRFGTEHTELCVHADPAEMLDPLIKMYDEPFADSSALPTSLICQAAREHVTVALAGDGGDEVFAGYDRYRAMHMGSTMSASLYAALRLATSLARPWAAHNERNRIRRLIRFVDGLGAPPSVQYFKYRTLFTSEDLRRLFYKEFADTLSVETTETWFEELYEQDEDLSDEVTRSQMHDMNTYLPDDLLIKTDIASMAASLELRAPFLDHEVVTLGLSLPVSHKIQGHHGKAILRDAFSDMLPADLFRRPKRGFAVPLGHWLRKELRETLIETLMDPSFLNRKILEPVSVLGLINDHLRGRDDHSHRLWALLVFARWLELQES